MNVFNFKAKFFINISYPATFESDKTFFLKSFRNYCFAFFRSLEFLISCFKPLAATHKVSRVPEKPHPLIR